MKGSIRTRLILLFVAVGLLPLIIVFAASYLIYSASIRDITTDVAGYNSEWVVDNISKFFRNSESTLSIIESRSMYSFLRTDEETPSASWEILELFDLYKKSLFDSDALQNISVLGLNGKCINMRDGFYRMAPEDIRRTGPAAAVLRLKDDSSILLPMNPADYRKNRAPAETLPLGRKLKDPATLETIGIVFLDFYPEQIEKYYRNVKGNIIGEMELVNTTSPSVSGTESKRSLISYFRYGLEINKPIPYKDWYLKYRISSSEIQEPLRNAIRLLVIVLIISIVIIVFAFFFISAQIIAPLQILRRRMKQAASGDFSTRFDLSTDDEVMVGLRDSFNRMVYDLENLMKQKDLEHENYLQAHFRMLQQQINPHFLYNTMDTIVWMALEKRNDEVIELVESLSTFFRLNLSKGIDVISISNSIICLESYLSIQKMRYSESLNYIFGIDQEIENGKILKLILQPIVENALYHGIQEKGGGTIRIEGRRDGENVLFTVSDDGAGVTPKRLAELTESLNLDEAEADYDEEILDGHGFGLRNVHNRIKLYYGDEYGIEFAIPETHGFIVKIRLPWIE